LKRLVLNYFEKEVTCDKLFVVKITKFIMPIFEATSCFIRRGWQHLSFLEQKKHACLELQKDVDCREAAGCVATGKAYVF
jgi:hypothetical protein